MAFLAHDTWFSVITLAVMGVTAVFWLIFGKVKLRRTPLDGWLALFVLTAVLAWWVAPKNTWAAAKFGVLLVAVLVYYLAAGLTRQRLWLAVGMLSGGTAVVALYFLLSHDWQSWPADAAILTRLGLRWMAIRLFTELPPLHPNKVAGLLAVFLPLMVTALWHAARQRQWVGAGGVGLATAVSLIALLLSSSRGAWLALLGGVSLAGMVGILLERGVKRPWLLPGLGMAILLLGSILLFISGNLAGGGLGRPQLVQQTLHLIADYPFTGGGLVSFGPLYSQYVRIIPFFFFSYAHNLYLGIWLEQGPLTLLAFLGLMVGALRWLLRRAQQQEDELTWLRLGMLAGLLTLLLHGWVDDALYGTWGAPQLLLLAGLAVAQAQQSDESVRFAGWRRWLVVGAVGMGVGTAVIFHRPLLAAWYANWGAVHMARVELANWPTNRWDDDRLAKQVNPSFFAQSLRWNPKNSTAHFHLGRIALAQRDFPLAIAHLRSALSGQPDHRGIIKTLGYSYAWMGDYENAQPLLEQIPEAKEELGVYSWWWSQNGRADLARHAEFMASQIK